MHAPTANRQLEKRRERHAPCIRREVARVEAAAEDELAQCGRADRIEPGRVVQLAHLDADADSVSCRAAHGETRAGRQHARPPRDHHCPQRVAEHIARDRTERGSPKVHAQAEHDGSAGQREECCHSSHDWVRTGDDATWGMRYRTWAIDAWP